MDIEIRKVQEADFPFLLEMFQEFALFEKRPDDMKNTLARMQKEKDYIKAFVAVNLDGEIIAYVTYFFTYYTWSGKSLYMDDLYIKPNYRGNGLGTRLINKVIAFAKENDCQKLKWQVSEWNDKAKAFYKNLGATIDSVEENCEMKLS